MPSEAEVVRDGGAFGGMLILKSTWAAASDGAMAVSSRLDGEEERDFLARAGERAGDDMRGTEAAPMGRYRVLLKVRSASVQGYRLPVCALVVALFEQDGTGRNQGNERTPANSSGEPFRRCLHTVTAVASIFWPFTHSH